MKNRFKSLDLVLLKGSALISLGMLAARGLGFLFYLILARVFNPASYGEIQYAIALAEIVAIGTQPFGQHVLARYIGKNKDESGELTRFLSNSWIIMLVIFILSMVIALPLLLRFTEDAAGVLIVVAGLTLFYSYWGLARGFLASGRLVIAYLGANLLQLLLTLLLIQVLGIKSIFLALGIYGGTYLLPILLLQMLKPLPLSFDRQMLNWGTIKAILSFSLPILLSHATYMLTLTLDILLIKSFADADAVGKYSLAKTISALFIFVPGGISTVLMPRIASQPATRHRALLAQALALSLIINLAIFLAYFFFGEWAIKTIFGAEYLSDARTLFTLSAGMILIGVHSIYSAMVVGQGRANLETISRFVMLAVFALVGWLTIPVYKDFGGALATVATGVSGLLVFSLMAFLNRRQS